MLPFSGTPFLFFQGSACPSDNGSMKMTTGMEHVCNDNDKRNTLSQCHFVHQKCLMAWTQMEPWSPRWQQASNPHYVLCLLSPTAEVTEDTLKSIETYVAFLQGSGLCEPATTFSDTLHAYNPKRPGSSCSIMTRPWLGRQKNCGSIPRRCKIFVFSPKRTDKLWGPTIS